MRLTITLNAEVQHSTSSTNSFASRHDLLIGAEAEAGQLVAVAVLVVAGVGQGGDHARTQPTG